MLFEINIQSGQFLSVYAFTAHYENFCPFQIIYWGEMAWAALIQVTDVQLVQ